MCVLSVSKEFLASCVSFFPQCLQIPPCPNLDLLFDISPVDHSGTGFAKVYPNPEFPVQRFFSLILVLFGLPYWFAVLLGLLGSAVVLQDFWSSVNATSRHDFLP